MKEDIAEFKSQNGNVNYSTKELVQALHTRMDKHFVRIYEKFDKVDNSFIKKDLFYKTIGFLFTCLAALSSYVLYFGK